MLQDCMQTDEAMEMFQRAIDLQPNVASSYVYLGYVVTMDTVGAYGVLLDYCMLWLIKTSTMP